MVRIARSISLLALVGCAGSVSVEDLDPFGGAASAVWFHSSESGQDFLMLSNVGGVCAKTQAYLEIYEEAWNDIADLDLTDSDYCEQAKEPIFAYARAGDALYHEGAHYLSLGVFDADGSVPEEDTYEVGDPERALGGSVTYFGESPYANILDKWDVKEDLEDGCGLSASDYDSDNESWTLADGDLEFTRVADERSAAGRLDGELIGDDGGDEGDITASFTASWCELDN